jgi:hypothetical protein
MDNSNSSINQQQQATDGTTPPPAPDTNQQGGEPSPTAPNLTKTKYDVMADAVLQDIAALRAALPQANVTETLTLSRRKGRTNVSREFLASAVNAVAASAELRAATQLDPDRGQETLQLLDAFGRVVTAFEQFASDVKLLLVSRRGELTDHSREAYGVAKGLIRSVKGSSLVIHVRKMKLGAKFNTSHVKGKGGGNQPNQGAN